jgi:hypothetical protein
MPDSYPHKRERDLRTEEFQGELLVYDLRSHQAHALNGFAAAVWHRCDGKTSVADLAIQLRDESGNAPDEDLVCQALDQLNRAALLDPPLEQHAVSDPSRREALSQLGWAAAIPLVLSIAMPSPAFAQTNGLTGPTGATGPTGPPGNFSTAGPSVFKPKT